MKASEILSKMYKGLKAPRNFDPDDGGLARPHCLIGEYRAITAKGKKVKGWQDALDFFKLVGFTEKEIDACDNGGSHGLTHDYGLMMIRSALRRVKKICNG